MPMPTLAINQFTTKPRSFEEDVEVFAQAGVSAVELCEAKLSEDAGEAREQVQRLLDAGVRVASVQPKVHALFPERMAKQPHRPEDRLKRFRQTMRFIADVLPSPGEGRSAIPLVLIGGVAPGHDYVSAMDTSRRLIPPLCDEAADLGLRIAFEPIHPVLMNVDTFVYALDEVLNLIDDVGRENFGYVCDVWHLWPEYDIARRLERTAGRVFMVHLSDWRRGGPKALDDRVQVGEGAIELPRLLTGLRRGGYRGDYALEILSDESLDDSLWKRDPQEVIRGGQRGFERAWKASEG